MPQDLTSREIEILSAAGTPPNMDPETWSRLFACMTGKGKDTDKGACKGNGVDAAEGGGGDKGKGEDAGGGGGKGKGEDAGKGGYSLRQYDARVYLMEAGTMRITAHDIAAHEADVDDIAAHDNADN
jgi:hypothetical protein